MVRVATPRWLIAWPPEMRFADINHSGSDVPVHLYSFSFNLNPDWSSVLAGQEEILECELPRKE